MLLFEQECLVQALVDLVLLFEQELLGSGTGRFGASI